MSDTEVTPDPEAPKGYTPGEEEPIEVRQAIAGKLFEDHYKCCYECGEPTHLHKDCPKYKAHMQTSNKKGGSHKGAWISLKEKPKENAVCSENG